MKNTVLKYGGYGLLAGLIIFGLHLSFLDAFDYSTNEILGYISIFVCLSFIYFGIKHYRDRVNEGVVSFGKALAIGVLISVLVGVGVAIADFIYTKFIDPDFFNDYAQMLRDQGKEDQIVEMTSWVYPSL